jgi:hypothetical protein
VIHESCFVVCSEFTKAQSRFLLSSTASGCSGVDKGSLPLGLAGSSYGRFSGL